MVPIAALRTELLTDASALGYSAFYTFSSAASNYYGDDNALADLLNTIRSSTITVGIVTAPLLQQGVVSSEYVALTQVQRDLWGAILAAATAGIAISNTVIRQQVGQVWSAATTTRSNLSNLQTRTCSRAESLWGEGTVVKSSEIALALGR